MTTPITDPTPEDLRYIKQHLDKQDIKEFFDIASVAATHETITRGIPGVYEGTHQFIRDVQTAELLQQKFPNMPYDTPDGFKGWLTDRLSGSTQSQANALSRLQGDGAGEVDFIREMQGNLRSLFTKTDVAKDAAGQITSNYPGIDAVEVSRLTDRELNQFQIKTLRSEDSIQNVLKEFQNNPHYNPDITLVGPEELIQEAKNQNLPNPLKAVGSVEENRQSAEALKNKIESGKMTTELTVQDVTRKAVGGAVIGAAISISISGLFNYIAFKKGDITQEELLKRIGKDGAKGAITGGALAGLSLFVPGGLIGAGIGFFAGTYLRRLLDDAFGEGTFADVLDLTKSVQANVQLLHHGSIYVAELVEADGEQIETALNTVEALSDERTTTLERLQSLENHTNQSQIVTDTYGDDLTEQLNKLDQRKQALTDM